VGAAVTVKVTGMFRGPDACVEVTPTLPLYTPAVRPVVLTDTVRLAGVLTGLVGVTESQVPPLVTAAVMGMIAPPLAVILVIWLDGVVPLNKV
jgi:hypothetical protein